MSRPWSTLWKQCRSFISGSKTVKRTLSALIWLPSGVYFTQYFYVLKSIKGTSMQVDSLRSTPDTSEWRDIVIFDRFTIRWLRRFERGDVVALRSPTDSKLVVKRIIALEGDTVKTLPPYPDTEINIPQGHAWVEGDEPFRSEDSNYFGPVPLALIESKLSFIVWPLSRYGPIQNPSIPEPKSLRRPGWRRDIAQIERQQWRNSRVKIAE